MSEKYQGGCQCGALRYEVTGELGKPSLCHCRMCQKAFGSFAAPFVPVPVQNFRWTRGVPLEFRSSAIVARGFCNQCGTPLFMHEDDDSQIEIAIGSLDQPNSIKQLTRQSGIESKLAWFDDMHKLSGEKTSDYRSSDDLDKLKSRQHPDHD